MIGSFIFQFHKGAIRTLIECNYSDKYLDFNSIKVRLELSAQLDQINFTTFQFHKGAIRTWFY